MNAKAYAALLALCLGLTPSCSSDGSDRAATANRRPPTPQPPAAANAAPGPSQPGGVSASVPAGGKSDACRLLTSEDIEAVQGEGLKEAKGSEQTDGPLLVGQCLYATANFNKSVSLTLTQKRPSSPEAIDPKAFWERQFGGEKEREKRREGEERGRGRAGDRDNKPEREGEEGESPAQPVKGVGDAAYWAGNQKVGVLYVLKGNRFLRISIGGPDDQRAKIEKMKELAKRALKRL